MAVRSRVLAVDLDPGMCRRVLWNAEVYDVGDRVLAVRSRAETLRHPARCVGSSLSRSPGQIGDRRAPALRITGRAPRSWESIVRSVPAGAIKVSPAADFGGHFPGRGIRGRADQPARRVQGGDHLVRRGGLVPSPGDPTARGRHLDRSRSTGPPGLPRSIPARVVDLRPRPVADSCRAARWVRAVHGISRVAEGVDYLTAADRVETPFLTAFAVRDSCLAGPQAHATDDRAASRRDAGDQGAGR